MPAVSRCLVGLALTLAAPAGRADEKKEEKGPGAERVAAGAHRAVEGQPALLAARRGDAWKRVAPGQPVQTAEPLVSLPGYLAELRLDGGARLTLRGLMPELARHPFMAFFVECAVTLHKPAEGVAADLTLHRGRVYLSNDREKGAAVVRLRFLDEVWDVTLQEPGSEVGVELLRHYTREMSWADEEPRVQVQLLVLKGGAGLRMGAFNFNTLEAHPGPCSYNWDNKGAQQPAPQRVAETHAKALLDVWAKGAPDTPAARAAVAALADVAKAVGDKEPGAALAEVVKGGEAAQRGVALLGLGALDDVPRLLDALASDAEGRKADRDAAVFALRRYVHRGRAEAKALYDAKAKSGFLADKKYAPREADTVLSLLHDFPEREARAAETYQLLINLLNHKERVAVRELAYWHLQRMSAGEKLPDYDAGWPEERRRAAAAAVKKLLDDGKLPPKPGM